MSHAIQFLSEAKQVIDVQASPPAPNVHGTLPEANLQDQKPEFEGQRS